jgi:hypothetical protein
MLKPQGGGQFYSKGRTCANGAALDCVSALYFDAETDDDKCSVKNNEALYRHFPITLTRPPQCPACGLQSPTLELAIGHLNDAAHRWSRERIADWVEQIEAQHAPQPEVGKQNLTEALR